MRDPLIVQWPSRMHDGGSIRTAFCHAIDITPTVLDVTGIELPEEFQGVGQVPLHGDSLAPGWEDAEIRIRSGSQYFEQLGHRGVWKDGWKAVTYHFKGTPFDQDQWALYNLEEDFSECHDLSGELPEKLEELVQTWWAEAEKYGVLPLDDRTLELLGGVRRPETPHNRREYVYYPPVSHVPADALARSPRLQVRATAKASSIRAAATTSAMRSSSRTASCSSSTTRWAGTTGRPPNST